MNRLTYRAARGAVSSIYAENFVLDMDEETYEGYLKVMDKLAHYEDLEEAGRLIELPFAVDGKVYQINEGSVEPCTVEVISIADYKDNDGNTSYIAEIHYDRDDCPYVSTEIYLTDVGKTVFFTYEEAEAALKERETE